jgi:hypothetical protein
MLLALSHAAFLSDLSQVAEALGLFFYVVLGLTVMLIGLIGFGIANLRRPVLSRWPGLPLATGLIGLGLVMWLEKPAQLEVLG